MEATYVYDTFRNGIYLTAMAACPIMLFLSLGYYEGGLEQFITDPFILYAFAFLLLVLATGIKRMIKPDHFEFYENMVKINGIDFQYSEMKISDLLKPGYVRQGFRVKISARIKKGQQIGQNIEVEGQKLAKVKRWELRNVEIRNLGGLSLYTFLSQRVPHSQDGKSAFDEI